MNKSFLYGILTLVFGSLACKPVFAIGWNELLFLFVVITAVLGPPLYKLLRRIEGSWKRRLKDK